MSYSGKFKDKNNNLHPVTSVLYGTCDTAAATAAKVVTCSDFDALMTGVTIRVKFANANTAASPTVNINSTGAKSVYRFGSTAPVDGNSWNAGEVVELVYDGTSFFMTGADDIAAKQNATDNSLQTTDKTVVGAINEHEGDIGSLKSGLTNLDNEVNGDATTYPYADVITIEDAVPSNLADCTVKIEPVQDLHGYDHPWVGGAGKNLFTGSDNTYTNDKAQTNVFAPTAVSKELTGAYYISFDYKVLESSVNNQALFYAMSNGSVVSGGNIFNFIDGNVSTNWIHMSGIMSRSVTFDAIYMFSNNKMTVKNVMVSATEGDYEPYSNICPITGHTEASVQRDGRNLWGLATSYTSTSSGDWVLGDGSLNLKSGTYTMSVSDSTDLQNTQVYIKKSNVVLTNFILKSNEGRVSKTFTISEDSDGVAICMYGNARTISDIQLELGSTATPYVPYAGKTYTIALGDTIYGGTVDFNTGVMTASWISKVYEGAAGEGWYRYTGLKYQITDNDYKTIETSVTPNYICNENRIVSDNYFFIVDTPCISFSSDHYMRVNFGTSFADVTEFKTYLASNPLQVCYELATPTTIQLTPQQIQLLKGQNTLTASTGQISVTVNGVSGSIGAVQEQVNDHEERINDHEERIDAVESGKANAAVYSMGGGQTVNIKHTDIVAIMSDRGGLYTDGIANRGVNDLVPSTQITVTHVDSSNITVANNSQYGTSILVLSNGDITITLVQ